MKKEINEIKVKKFDLQQEGDLFIATTIADLIRKKQAANELAVLGLATGSSVLGVYRELIRMHKEEDLSFHNVVSFNLDEYFPIQATHPLSYHTYMNEKLFDHVNIQKQHIFIPNGNVEETAVESICEEYENTIKKFGGIDLQLLGIGRNGHIGFNEPGSEADSRTRMITLDSVTRNDAASGFGGLDKTPTHAITAGVATILDAKKIILMAWSTGKAAIIAQVLSSEVSSEIPASFLKHAEDVTFVLDKEAAAEVRS